MKEAKVFLDMDGIIADFVPHTCFIHDVENPYLRKSNAGQYNMHTILKMNKTQFFKPMDEEFWFGIPKTFDADDIIEVVLKFVPEDRICILSSPTVHPGSLSGKLRWLNRHYHDFTTRFLMGPKKQFCATHNAVLVDDSHDNTESFVANGGHAVLYPRKWNKHHHIGNDNYDNEKCHKDLNRRLKYLEISLETIFEKF